MVALTGNEDGNFLDSSFGGAMSRPYSEATAQTVDRATKRIIDESYEKAVRLLTQERVRLDNLAEELLREESLDYAQMLEITGLSPHPTSVR